MISYCNTAKMLPPPAFFITLGFTLFTLPLYVAMIVFIIRRRKQSPYNSSFFKLWLALAFGDILSSANGFFLTNAVSYSYLYVVFGSNVPAFLPYYCAFVGYCSQFVQLLTNVLIAFNRYTAIATPIKHKLVWLSFVFLFHFQLPLQIWSNKNLYRLLAGVFTFSAFLALPMFLTSDTLIWNDAAEAYGYVFSNISIMVGADTVNREYFWVSPLSYKISNYRNSKKL